LRVEQVDVLARTSTPADVAKSDSTITRITSDLIDLETELAEGLEHLEWAQTARSRWPGVDRVRRVEDHARSFTDLDRALVERGQTLDGSIRRPVIENFHVRPCV